MTTRERFVRTITGKSVDRVPFMKIFGGTNAVVPMWKKRYPDIGGYVDELLQFEGVYRGWQRPPVNCGLCGLPEDRIVHESPTEVHIRRGSGALVVHMQRGDHSFKRTAEYPAKTRDDWARIKRDWMDPKDPRRFPSGWDHYVDMYNRREYPLQLTCGGVYGFARNILGDELLMISMYDDPDWVSDIVDTYIVLCIEVWKRMVNGISFDLVECWEDMAYKSGSLISREHFEAFLGPKYRMIREFADDAGIPIVMVDSDGNIMELSHWMHGAGVNCMYPYEVQAGNDFSIIRRELPGMSCVGALDKSCMAKGGNSIDDELERARILIRGGRCIPGPDHFVLEDTPFENYVRFMRGLREIVMHTKVE